uniref:Uncharacterized protein n=1 Tax=Oryza brachyantha TaxID=4533 RepID=J3LSH6_ORYBR
MYFNYILIIYIYIYKISTISSIEIGLLPRMHEHFASERLFSLSLCRLLFFVSVVSLVWKGLIWVQGCGG